MIILATAIILSLNNSGIIGKANKAKNDTDIATIKEYVNTLWLDWELMTSDEKTATGFSNFNDYANAKLIEGGYTGAVLDVNGEVYSGLTENAREAIAAGLKIGDYVILNYAEDVTTTSGKENTAPDETEIVDITDGSTKQTITLNKGGYQFVYTGISDEGELELLGSIGTGITPTIKLSGKGGYLYGAGELNDVCDKLFSSDYGKARSINFNDVIKLLGYTGNLGEYRDANVHQYYDKEPLTIGQIEGKLGVSLSEGKRYTPDGKNIATNYKSDLYYIGSNDSSITNVIGKRFVFNSNVPYWIASNYSYVCFHQAIDSVEFGLRIVDVTGGNNYSLNGKKMYNSKNASSAEAFCVCPVLAYDGRLSRPEGIPERFWKGQ